VRDLPAQKVNRRDDANLRPEQPGCVDRVHDGAADGITEDLEGVVCCVCPKGLNDRAEKVDVDGKLLAESRRRIRLGWD